MGMAVPIYWTADMVRALPDDGKQYETVNGELLVSPAPRVWHEVIVDRLSGYLRDYVRLTSGLLWLTGHPRLARHAVGLASHSPRLVSHLVGVAGGTRRLLPVQFKPASSMRV